MLPAILSTLGRIQCVGRSVAYNVAIVATIPAPIIAAIVYLMH
jgi:hypothetical protein